MESGEEEGGGKGRRRGRRTLPVPLGPQPSAFLLHWAAPGCPPTSRQLPLSLR